MLGWSHTWAGWIGDWASKALSLLLAPLGPSHQDCQVSSFTLATNTKSCEQYNSFTSALQGCERRPISTRCNLLLLEDHQDISPSSWLRGLPELHLDNHLYNPSSTSRAPPGLTGSTPVSHMPDINLQDIRWLPSLPRIALQTRNPGATWSMVVEVLGVGCWEEGLGGGGLAAGLLCSGCGWLSACACSLLSAF